MKGGWRLLARLNLDIGPSFFCRHGRQSHLWPADSVVFGWDEEGSHEALGLYAWYLLGFHCRRPGCSVSGGLRRW